MAVPDHHPRFVEATGYVTVAERTPARRTTPGAPAEKPGGGLSGLLAAPGSRRTSGTPTPGGSYVGGSRLGRHYHRLPAATWREGRAPRGPGRTTEDASAYCAGWAGGRPPTEAEFEYAERGGLDRKPFAWGDTFRTGGKWMANTYPGRFPTRTRRRTASLPPPPWARSRPTATACTTWQETWWEWCATGTDPATMPPPCATRRDRPAGPSACRRVARFLCSDQYCARYMPGGRGKGEPDAAHEPPGLPLRDAGETMTKQILRSSWVGSWSRWRRRSPHPVLTSSSCSPTTWAGRTWDSTAPTSDRRIWTSWRPRRQARAVSTRCPCARRRGRRCSPDAYPMRYGLQTGVIPPQESYGIPTDEWLLPQALKHAGYETAIVGKWHLGHGDRKLWPRQRGFDHQYGPPDREIDTSRTSAGEARLVPGQQALVRRGTPPALRKRGPCA
jgi:formylglycine-generating enzyme required for sulfatase activity